MDIIIGSGNKRQKVTFASGYAMRKHERDNPKQYVKDRGAILNILRSNRS